MPAVSIPVDVAASAALDTGATAAGAAGTFDVAGGASSTMSIVGGDSYLSGFPTVGGSEGGLGSLFSAGNLLGTGSSLSGLGSIFSGVSGLFGGGGGSSPGNIQAALTNAQANVTSTDLLAQYKTYLQAEPLLPLLYTYAGYSPDQIKGILQNNRTTLGQQLDAAASQISSTAWGSGAQGPLAIAAASLGNQGGANLAGQGYLQGGPNATPIPSLDSLTSNLPTLTPKFTEQFAFNPNVAQDPLYQWEEQQRERNQNMSDASKGLLNSGYSAQANAFGANALAVQQGNQMYGRQLGEYQMRATQNQIQQQQDLQRFGALLSTSGQNQTSALAGEQIMAGAAQTGAQLTSSLTGTAANLTLGQQQIGQQYAAGANNVIQGGIGTALNYSNAQSQQQLNAALYAKMFNTAGQVA